MAYRRWLVRHRQWMRSFRAGVVPPPAVGSGQAPPATVEADETRPGAAAGPDAAGYPTELEFVFVTLGSDGAATKRSSNATGGPVYETALVGWLAAHFVDAGGVGEEPEFMGKVGLNLIGSFVDLFAADDQLALFDDRVVKVVKVRVPIEQNRTDVDFGHFPDALNGPFLLPGMNIRKLETNLLRGQLINTSSPGQALAGAGPARPPAAPPQEPPPEAEPRPQRTLIGFFLSILTDIATTPMTYVVLVGLLCVWVGSRQRTVSGH